MRILHGKICTRILYLFTFVFISSLLSLAFFTRRSKYDGPPPPFQRPVGSNSFKGIDPLLYNSGPPSGRLWYPGERPLANATLLTLARNSEADSMWRVEPNVHFYCNLPYDSFHFLADRDLIYGFVIALYDALASITSLWPEVLRFLASYNTGKGSRAKSMNPTEFKERQALAQTLPIHHNAAVGFFTDSYYRPLHTLNASGYSTCHFWSNFEIGDMDFFRSPLYQAYFRHLDKSGDSSMSVG
ncbi:glycolipid 2-alpha-mannosyltransferase-domain-containing protein [Tirmania nivea]|nr:glycolipid 2-alpha-mannosyltransferase-domain-containing protein [Tirmania nivea]